MLNTLQVTESLHSQFFLPSNASLSWLGTSFFSRVRHLWIRCIPEHSNLEQGYSKNTILAKSRGGSVARRLRTLLWLTNVKPTQLSTALSHPCRQIMKSRFLLSLFLNSSRHQKSRKFPCHFVEQKVLLKRFHSRGGEGLRIWRWYGCSSEILN